MAHLEMHVKLFFSATEQAERRLLPRTHTLPRRPPLILTGSPYEQRTSHLVLLLLLFPVHVACIGRWSQSLGGVSVTIASWDAPEANCRRPTPRSLLPRTRHVGLQPITRSGPGSPGAATLRMHRSGVFPFLLPGTLVRCSSRSSRPAGMRPHTAALVCRGLRTIRLGTLFLLFSLGPGGRRRLRCGRCASVRPIAVG